MAAGFHTAGSPRARVTLPGLCGATRIATRGGNIPVEWLRPGDLVLTRDAGYLPLLWAGPGHSGGPGHPTIRLPRPPADPAATALRLAAGHGILVTIAERAARFGTAEALVDAGRAIGARPEPARRDAQHPFHLLLGSHEIVLADGVWVETLAAAAVAHCLPPAALPLAEPLLRRGPAPVRPRIDRSDLGGGCFPAPSTPHRSPPKNSSFRVA